MKKITFETVRNETLGEEVHSAWLPGGLPVVVVPKREFRKKYACYSTFYGSVDSCFRPPGAAELIRVPDGIAHFLEHTLFESKEGNVSDLFARNGAYNNAATSFATTSYLFASSDRFLDNLGLLTRFVENPVFDPAKVEKEKGIIEQEILRYQDDPGWVQYMGLLASLFVEHPLRIDIAGTAESIRAITPESLHRCYETFYNPANMLLLVVGDVDTRDVLAFVAETSRYGLEAVTPPERIERSYPEEPTEVASPRFEIVMEVALPKLLVGYKEVGLPAHGRELLELEVVTEFALDLLFGHASDAYLDLYVAQLALEDFSSSYGTCAGAGYVMIGGETPDPDGLRAGIARVIEGVRDHGLDAEDFERQKRKFIGGFIRSFNSLEYIASNYTYHRFYGLDLFDTIDVLHALERGAVEARIRNLFAPERRAEALILPKA